MKLLTISLLIILMTGLSGCYTAKMNYAPDDTIFIIPESPLIQYAISKKKMSYRLGFMKNKGQRFKHIRRIQSLNETALKRFKENTLSADTYSGICTISCVTLQIVTWVAILEYSQGKQVKKSISITDIQSLKSQKFSNEELNRIISRSNLETEDGIAEFLKQVAELIEQLLKDPQ